MMKIQPAFLALATVALSVSFAQAAPPTKLKINGKIASTRLKMVGGVAYVPVADIAKALGQKVTPMPGGLELKTASGTYQVNGLAGKIGSVIQTPKFSFQVLSVQTTDSYPSKWLKTPETFTPDGPNDTLFIVNCRITNTLSKTQGPILARHYAGNTAIADYEGESYPPKDFDSRIQANYSGASMLPGSKSDFAVIFSVPKTAKNKDLVFTVRDYVELGEKGSDVRISLQ
ncbi:MAG TPA: hypothetical protein VGB45_13285 [Abditibacterium sp.]|jgi:hypothetical protein